MLGIDAVPALGNPQIRRTQELPRVAKDDLVDLFLVEDIDDERVLVRVAERERSVGSLRNQRVDSPAVVFGGLFGDAPAKRRGCATNLKSGIETQREPGRKRGAELQTIRLRNDAHHLQFETSQAASRIVLRINSLEIIPSANNHGLL